MQCEKPTADVVLAGQAAAGAPPGPVDDGLPPHAAASRARTAVAMTPATVRAGRRGRRMTRGLSFMLSSSSVGRGSAFAGRPPDGAPRRLLAAPIGNLCACQVRQVQAFVHRGPDLR